MTRTLRRIYLAATVLALTVAAAGCAVQTTSGGTAPLLSGWVSTDGSGTMAPLSHAAAELFLQDQPSVNVTVASSSSAGEGIARFCGGHTDILAVSRKIHDNVEKDLCAAAGINPTEFVVANDGVSVVVNPETTWVNCLTTTQLKTIWDEGSRVTNWNQVDPKFPNVPLGPDQLFGPSDPSGNFDFFTAQINGAEKRSRSNYTASEIDAVIVQGVVASKGGLGYIGYNHYLDNKNRLKLVNVDSGSGCTHPNVASIQSGSYKPLSRPLYIYVSSKSVRKPHVKGFVEFYIKNIDQIVEEARFVALTPAQKAALNDAFARFEIGA